MKAQAIALGVALVVAVAGAGPVRADDRAVAWARTFRNLAGVDFRAAGDVLGGGGDLAMGGLFERRVDAAAFFSTAFLFVQPDAGGFVAGFHGSFPSGVRETAGRGSRRGGVIARGARAAGAPRAATRRARAGRRPACRKPGS